MCAPASSSLYDHYHKLYCACASVLESRWLVLRFRVTVCLEDSQCHILPINSHPKTKAIMAAAHPYCTAVALTEPPAAIVSFQRHPPSFPPSQNVNSVASPLLAAVQFSGNSAICDRREYKCTNNCNIFYMMIQNSGWVQLRINLLKQHGSTTSLVLVGESVAGTSVACYTSTIKQVC